MSWKLGLRSFSRQSVQLVGEVMITDARAPYINEKRSSEGEYYGLNVTEASNVL